MYDFLKRPFPIRFLTALTIGLFLCGSSPARADEDEGEQTESKISFMILSADRLLEDLQYMVEELAGREKIWNEKVSENIELFLEGVEREQPVRIDLLFDEETGEYYRPFFPYSDLADFRNNVDAFGITNKRIARDVYLLDGAFEGYMKVADNYAIFAPTDYRDAIDPDPPAPQEILTPLKEADYDAGIIMRHDAAGMDSRRVSIGEVRKNLLAGIKKKSTESPEEFDFRKLLAANQIDNFQQLYAEIRNLEAGWITDPEEKIGTGVLNLSGIEGTELAETLAEIPELKSRFHAIPQTENFVATGRMLIPVPLSIQERTQETLKTYQPVAEQRIDRKEDLSDDQKKAAKEAIGKLIPMLSDGTTLGIVDGFMEVRRINPDQADSKHDMVAGLRVKTGRDIEEVISMLPQIRDSYETRMETEQSGDFYYHEVTLRSNVPPMIDSLFGTPCHIHLATSDNMLLFSIGKDSKEWLVEMVELVKKTDEEKTPENFLTFKGHFGPFAKALSAREPKAENENILEFRKAVIEAFSSEYTDDFIELTDTYQDGEVRGTMTVEPGLLRLLGIMAANFADENL